VPSDIQNIKKRLEELEETVKKHTSAAVHADKKRLDDLEARMKALEETVKKKL
jgi:tetrahydromethanopterin S-methyltransferase subunit G